MFGPCRIPLVLPSVGRSGLTPTALIKLSDYGLVLSGPAKPNVEAEKGSCRRSLVGKKIDLKLNLKSKSQTDFAQKNGIP